MYHSLNMIVVKCKAWIMVQQRYLVNGENREGVSYVRSQALSQLGWMSNQRKPIVGDLQGEKMFPG